MTNQYVPDMAPLAPGATARSADVNERYENVVSGLDKLPAPAVGKQGFSAPVPVGEPTDDDHAATKSFVETSMASQVQQAATSAQTATNEANRAQGYADDLEIPSKVGNGGKSIRQASDESGFEYVDDFDAYGLGNASTAGVVTLDDAKTTGMFRYQSTDPSVPEAGASGPVLVLVNSASSISQIAFRGASGRMFTRAWDGAAWTSWEEQSSRGNSKTIHQITSTVDETDYTLVTAGAFNPLSASFNLTPTTATSKVLVTVITNIRARDTSGDDANSLTKLRWYNGTSYYDATEQDSHGGLNAGLSDNTYQYDMAVHQAILSPSERRSDTGDWTIRLYGDPNNGNELKGLRTTISWVEFEP